MHRTNLADYDARLTQDAHDTTPPSRIGPPPCHSPTRGRTPPERGGAGAARQALAAAGVSHEYIEFGSYFSQWRVRTALKMWTGWPTFPMVFVRGTLVGGADDLRRLIDSGEPQAWLKT